MLKYFANPLMIKNYSVAHSSKKQYKTEKHVYGYSASRKIVSVIGHTHRPLFASMPKKELSKNRVGDKSAGADKTGHKGTGENVYDKIFHVPCLFNSGCAIGKRGMTCLEIKNGTISLVHWFDGNINKKYLRQSGYSPKPLGGSGFYRMVINEEALDDVFDRIRC